MPARLRHASPALGLLLAASAIAAPAPVQLTIRSRMVVRVETQVMTLTPVEWRERKGPRCLATATILGAAVVAPGAVDFILRGGQRLRARFSSSCPGLAYYSGFYVVPNADGQMCGGRDAVRDRAGGECEVAKLRLLEPKR